jgi:predicted tellurium resistance membrane protein TerC
LAFGFWLLAFGFWLLAFGFWLLAFGFWLLAFGIRAPAVNDFHKYYLVGSFFIRYDGFSRTRPDREGNSRRDKVFQELGTWQKIFQDP